jgi:hypothetical protein
MLVSLRPGLLALLVSPLACGGGSSHTGANPADASTGTASDAASGSDSPAEASPGDAASGDSFAADAIALDAHAPGDAAAADAGLPLPSPLYGVTVDDVSALPAIVTSLGALPHRPTTRIVFDEGQAPAAYEQAVPAIQKVSYVLGELLDSSAVAQITPTQYAQRTSDYLAAFPTGVDVWEVGNEINGNWLGAAADVASKMTQAFDLVKAAGQRAELTLYGCSDSGAAYDMIAWTNANVPARMRTGLDYVLVSYYEGDCGTPVADWTGAFQQLRGIFPTAGLGFGEVGYVDSSGNDLALQSESAAATYLGKYYGMPAPVSGYVGGYFWWYFAADMVPDTQPLFAVLGAAMK